MPANTNPNNTTSDGTGRNIRAELCAISAFYIGTDNNGTTNFIQKNDDKFGIVDEAQFRTTSKINYTGKVYSICIGQVFLQPNTQDNTKVNLIVRPFRQPINGLPIKYFVYRGLNKSDFLTADEKQIQPKGENATGFVNSIREEFEKFNSQNGSVPPFLSKYIGYPNSEAEGNEIQQETDLLDNYFFKLSTPKDENGEPMNEEINEFELPIIPQGTFLGNASETLGIDVILNEGDYTIENDPNPFKLNLDFARSSDYVLNTSLGLSDFQKKLVRESATQFIDIAAFYGLHAHGKGKIYTNGQKDNPVEDPEKIFQLIEKYKTATTTYLYIQSNRQRSYNFYGNYEISENDEDNMMVGTKIADLTKKKFDEGWSVWQFPNVPSLVLKLTTDHNSSAGLYVKQGILNSSTNHEDYFIRDKNLLEEIPENTTGNLNFTKPLIFDFVKEQNGKSVSSIIQLIYEGVILPVGKTIDTENPENTQIIYMKDIDDVFGLIDVKPLIQAQSQHEKHYVTDHNLLLINFENKTGGKDIATVTTKRVEDVIQKNEDETLPRFTYETLLNNIRQNTGSFFQSNSAYIDNSNSGTISYSKGRNNLYTPEKPYYLKTEVFTGFDGNTITGLSLQVQDGTLPSKKLLGITGDENDKFRALIDSNQLNNPKFFFKNELEDEESYYTSSEGIQYRKYSLCVIGENQNGELKFFEPESKVFVTTIDQCVFASEGYSKWVPIVKNIQGSNINMKLPK